MPTQSKDSGDVSKRSKEKRSKKGSREGSQESIGTKQQPDAREEDNSFKRFPFWCGYLPDKDARDLLQNRNEFLLRKKNDDDESLCVLTIAQYQNKVWLLAFVGNFSKCTCHFSGHRCSCSTPRKQSSRTGRPNICDENSQGLDRVILGQST